MPVLLFDSNEPFHVRWADQWQKADPINRKKLPIDGNGSHEHIRDVIVNAVRVAGNTSGNELIIAVGHGGAAGLTDGTVDLAPQRKTRLTRGVVGSRTATGAEIFYDPFYDVQLHPPLPSDKANDEDPRVFGNTPPAKFRLGRYALYQNIGAAIQTGHIYKVIFLTCNVGNAISFIQKIAIDWQVLVKAYKRFLVFQLNLPGSIGKVRVFLEGDSPGMGSNTPAREVNLPQIDFITVGPPPSPPPPPPSVVPPTRKKAGKISPGPGRFRTTEILTTRQLNDELPHALSPAARTLDPLDMRKLG